MKGIFAGVIVGIVGALVWAGISSLTGYEIGWLAWGIGAAVGGAVAWGSKGSKVNGVIAVVIAIAAIAGGKLATVEMILAKEMELANEQIKQAIDTDDEYMLTFVAAGIAYNYNESGIKIDWPEGVDPEQASEKKDYPAAIWGIAEATWAAMSEEDKANFRRTVEDEVNANIEQFASSVRGEGFLASFSGFDVIFFLLAIMTAFKVASNAGVAVAEESGDEAGAQRADETDLNV